MVYRSFGLPCSQSEIWHRIARPGPWESSRANTYSLCADALDHGLAALTFQARDPWRVLEASAGQRWRVILNHRPSPGSPAGHYTVLVGVEGEEVILHDPARGPSQRHARADLLELWQPGFGPCEITGRVLVAIAPGPSAAPACPGCGSLLPELIPCPGCRHSIRLEPQAVLGCAAAACPLRAWEYIFCPRCDMAVSQERDRRPGEFVFPFFPS